MSWNKAHPQPSKQQGQPRQVPAVSFVHDGNLVELLYDPVEQRTSFCIWKEGAWSTAQDLKIGAHTQAVPYSPQNNLIKNEVVLLPSAPEEYGSETDLLRDVQAFIHQYVDVSPQFERIASYYVLFSWVYDCFNELPYLRLRGDYGSGKTRFLLTVGSICYKPAFASGASTVSPIFHILDAFRGTLVIDEGDFRYSDEKADIVKILNNGNVKGLPVLRTEVSRTGEFNPRAFHVFGPKLVASRGHYEDRALESRFITEEMGGRKLRRDIPINLPEECRRQALALRNKLLLYRFRHFGKSAPRPDLVDPTIEPRLNQIFVPLMSIVEGDEALRELRAVAKSCQEDLLVDRGLDIEAQVLQAIQSSMARAKKRSVVIKDVAHELGRSQGDDFDQAFTPKWVGTVIRRRLHIRTQKRNGVFVIPPTEIPRLQVLYERYGITESGDEARSSSHSTERSTASEVDIGDVGDFGAHAPA